MSFNNGDEAFKLNVETSGNLLSGISHALGSKRNGENQYTLFNIAFAQYVKGDFDYTKVVNIDRNNSFWLFILDWDWRILMGTAKCCLLRNVIFREEPTP